MYLNSSFHYMSLYLLFKKTCTTYSNLHEVLLQWKEQKVTEDLVFEKEKVFKFTVTHLKFTSTSLT